MGYTGKLLKKFEKNFHNKSFPQKTIPEIVSMVVHMKNFEKRNAKFKNLFSYEYYFHKNLNQRSHQWGTQEIN